VSGHCPSSGILNKQETQDIGNDLFLSSGERRVTPTLLGPLESANFNHWEHYLEFQMMDEFRNPVTSLSSVDENKDYALIFCDS
jgi:hypothetical protein